MQVATERNYEIVALAKHEDCYTVVTQRDGGDDEDTGIKPSEFVGFFELDDGIFDYFTESEKKILRRGFTKEGEDKNPATGRKRREVLALAKELGLTEDEGSQVCRICEVEQSTSEFSRYARAKTGRRNYCKTCAREASKKYAEAQNRG